ncbi:nascent polypeptide-associated complex beta subunit [Trifolium repens]|nr:nascent polypeptide-associated complex beta subunit [Trifolium repens]
MEPLNSYHSFMRLVFYLYNLFPFAELQDILPNIIHQLGPDNLENLKKLAEQYQKQAPEAGADATTAQEDDDDAVPDLVPGETFETAAEEETKA